MADVTDLAKELARLQMILAARDAYERGEPSRPPVTGRTPADLPPHATEDTP